MQGAMPRGIRQGGGGDAGPWHPLVEGGADQEAADGDREANGGDGIADGPADVLLDVHDHRCAEL